MSNEERAINGGPLVTRKPFPEWPAYDEQEIGAVTPVITSRQRWRIAGSQNDRYEQGFAAYQEAKHALGVTNSPPTSVPAFPLKSVSMRPRHAALCNGRLDTAC